MLQGTELSDAAQPWIISYLLYSFSAFCGCTGELYVQYSLTMVRGCLASNDDGDGYPLSTYDSSPFYVNILLVFKRSPITSVFDFLDFYQASDTVTNFLMPWQPRHTI